jgi:hypothetical protein
LPPSPAGRLGLGCFDDAIPLSSTPRLPCRPAAAVRFLAQHALIDLGLAAAFVGTVLWSEALSIGSMQMGAAVMLLKDPFAQAWQDVYGRRGA